ncbi:MAG: FIST N-terminal domain-containing protein [Pseudomonadota bacterium]
MNIITAESTKDIIEDIVPDIKLQIGDFDAKMVLFFASAKFDPAQTAEKMQHAFGESLVFGCSTAGEIVSGQMLKNSVVAMAFNSEIIGEAKIEVVENIKDESGVKGIDKAFAAFENYFEMPMRALDFQNYVGIALIDGLSGAEEGLMDRIGDLTNVLFVGGSVGDDLKFETTYVYANGKVYTNAALLVLIKPKVNFGLLKTQSFCQLPQKLVATKVNEFERTVIEFNNKPAVVAYAEAVGSSVEEVSSRFMVNPVGLMIDDEPYVRSPQQIKGNNMVFYCNVLEGMELTLLESGDIIGDTRVAIEEKQKEMGSISAIINFHCILRTLELEKKGLTGSYGEIFSDIPTIGFSTYGEEYIGHVNQTSTMLVFE